MSEQRIASFGAVILSTITYSSLLKYFYRSSRFSSELRPLIKFISACHATAASGLSLLALFQQWDTKFPSNKKLEQSQDQATLRLDDSANPLIVGRNRLANFITAWEAGYLIYDTGALYLESHRKDKTGSPRSAVARLLKQSPLFVTHHALLISALLYLQTYVANRREKGVQVIMAFFLMNASTPLLHLRWWRKRSTGRSDRKLDTALAIVFALTRFGTVYWAIKTYGKYHGLKPWEALRRQRLVCKMGTGLLTTANVVWWLGLLSQMAKKSVTK